METIEAGIIDLLLATLLVILAGAGLLMPQLSRAVMAFIGFGLVMAVVWIRLDAVDIALAEAMIGSGITGALFLAALGRMARAEKRASRKVDRSAPANHAPRMGVGSWIRVDPGTSRWRNAPAAAAVTLITILVLVNVFPLPAPKGDIPGLVTRNLPDSGVENPVTAVLLNFRAYDTLLEIGVVLLALLGLRAVEGRTRSAPKISSGSVLTGFYRMTLPFLILFSAYMVWVGKYEPGGAFQAAALLAAGGIIGRMAGADPMPAGLQGSGLRVLVSAGFAVFLSIGVLLWIQSGSFLHFDPRSAGGYILIIEVAATVSIALSLIILFLGSSGAPRAAGAAGRLSPITGEAR